MKNRIKLGSNERMQWDSGKAVGGSVSLKRDRGVAQSALVTSVASLLLVIAR